jgi:hypothetical protein
MHRTLNAIRIDGLKALRQRLGRVGMVRFLQQFESGEGDYTRERQTWVNEISLENIKRLSRQEKSRSTPKSR